MAWLVQHTLLAIVVLSALGAAVTSAVIVAYGFTPPREDDELEPEERGADARPLLVTRLGHAIATVCFALIVVLAVLAQLAPSGTRDGSDQRAEIAALRANVQHLDAQLRDTLTAVDEKVAAAASPALPDTGQAKRQTTTEQPTVTPAEESTAERRGGSSGEPATAAEPPSRSRPAPRPRSARRDARPPLDLPSPPRSRPLGSSGSVAAPSVPRTLSESRPLPSTSTEAPAEPARTLSSAATPAPGKPGRLLTTVGDVHVELSRNREGGGADRVTSYTARLSDLAGRPIVASDVSLVGRMTDGTRAEASLDPTSTPGVYTARLVARPEGPHDLVLQVKLDTRRLEVPLE